jgi:hypothetical protein
VTTVLGVRTGRSFCPFVGKSLRVGRATCSLVGESPNAGRALAAEGASGVGLNDFGGRVVHPVAGRVPVVLGCAGAVTDRTSGRKPVPKSLPLGATSLANPPVRTGGDDDQPTRLGASLGGLAEVPDGVLGVVDQPDEAFGRPATPLPEPCELSLEFKLGRVEGAADGRWG